MIPTPKEAFELLSEYNKGEFHLKHGRTVGSVMRWFAEELGYGDEADFWETVGILHDLDFEQYPDQHCLPCAHLKRRLNMNCIRISPDNAATTKMSKTAIHERMARLSSPIAKAADIVVRCKL